MYMSVKNKLTLKQKWTMCTSEWKTWGLLFGKDTVIRLSVAS